MLVANPSGDGVVPYLVAYGVGTCAMHDAATEPCSGTSDSASGSSGVSSGVSDSGWGAGFAAAGGCALPAVATSDGGRLEFGDFSGGDFSDHGEISNGGMKATKGTTARWDDGFPPPHAGPRLLEAEAVGTVGTTRSALPGDHREVGTVVGHPRASTPPAAPTATAATQAALAG